MHTHTLSNTHAHTHRMLRASLAQEFGIKKIYFVPVPVNLTFIPFCRCKSRSKEPDTPRKEPNIRFKEGWHTAMNFFCKSNRSYVLPKESYFLLKEPQCFVKRDFTHTQTRSRTHTFTHAHTHRQRSTQTRVLTHTHTRTHAPASRSLCSRQTQQIGQTLSSSPLPRPHRTRLSLRLERHLQSRALRQQAFHRQQMPSLHLLRQQVFHRRQMPSLNLLRQQLQALQTTTRRPMSFSTLLKAAALRRLPPPPPPPPLPPPLLLLLQASLLRRGQTNTLWRRLQRSTSQSPLPTAA